MNFQKFPRIIGFMVIQVALAAQFPVFAETTEANKCPFTFQSEGETKAQVEVSGENAQTLAIAFGKRHAFNQMITFGTGRLQVVLFVGPDLFGFKSTEIPFRAYVNMIGVENQQTASVERWVYMSEAENLYRKLTGIAATTKTETGGVVNYVKSLKIGGLELDCTYVPSYQRAYQYRCLVKIDSRRAAGEWELPEPTVRTTDET